jgi:hypothetical protein
MIFGQPGHYKSLITTQIMLSIVNNIPFLEKETKKAPVLLCDMENGLIEIRDRIKKLLKSCGIETFDSPLFITESGINLDNGVYREALFKIVEEKGIKLVIMDTLNRFGTYDENSSSDINKVYTQVFKPLKELGCSVLFLHHTRKGTDEYRGSGDFLGNVDMAYNVRKNDSTLTIKNTKNRFGITGNEILCEVEFKEDAIFIEKREFPEMKEHKGSLARAFILNELLLGDSSSARVYEKIKVTHPDISRRTLEREIKKLLERGLLEHRMGLYHFEKVDEKVEDEN